MGAGGGEIYRRLDAVVYGKGLCFGMVVAALRDFDGPPNRSPLAGLEPSFELLDAVRRYHARQYRPRALFAAVGEWLRSSGGRPDGIVDRLRLPGVGRNPCLICFGPAINRSFLRCLARAHAVAPYRIEAAGDERRVFVYDPNYPKDRTRCVLIRGDATGKTRFSYDGFGTLGGWGISLFPLSAIGDTAWPSPRALP